MEFISYAQNYEDVMLWRVLGHIEKGFYVDVGAMDPINVSVTKAFYERGWHGINIEPVKHWFDKLVADRLYDINLNVAIAASGQSLHFFEVADTGSSTTSKALAESYRQQGFSVVEHDVPCQSLTTVCDAYRTTDIHFLKVDVEGEEASVLGSIDLTRIRPWVVVVESTEPWSTVETYGSWEPLLLNNNYLYAYFDGLNRFYVAKEHEDLLNGFSKPPNVFDQFIPAAQYHAQALANTRLDRLQQIQADAEQRLNAAQRERAEAEQRLNSAQRERAEAEQRLNGVWEDLRHAQAMADAWLNELQQVRAEAEQRLDTARQAQQCAQNLAEARWNELQIVYASSSWRIGAPLRRGMDFARLWMGRLRNPKRLAIGVVRRLERYSAVRSIGARVLAAFPLLHDRLRRVVKDKMVSGATGSNAGITSIGIDTNLYPVEHTLTPPARAVLSQLRKAMQQLD